MPKASKPTFKLEFPLICISESNNNDHWSKKRKRRIIQKEVVKVYWFKEKAKVKVPCIVKLTRLSNRKLDDDNLRGAFKAIRDTVADLILPGLPPGYADGDKRLEWQYDQQTVGTTKTGIRIEIFHPKEKKNGRSASVCET